MSLIPKKIHYCWFGKNPKNQLILDCIETWKKYLPDYEIIEWNEDNYDTNVIDYTREAYELKKWAFVSDYVRFDVLYKYGGIYLDVDVEFIKQIPTDVFKYSAFTGFESSGFVSPGLIFATVPENSIIKELLEKYKYEHFEINKKGIYKTVNSYLTELLVEKGLKKNNTFQVIEDIAIFPSEFFCGYDTDIHEIDITENTIAWHHYLGSWIKQRFSEKMKMLLKKIIGKKLYKKLILLKRKIKSRGQK